MSANKHTIDSLTRLGYIESYEVVPAAPLLSSTHYRLTEAGRQAYAEIRK